MHCTIFSRLTLGLSGASVVRVVVCVCVRLVCVYVQAGRESELTCEEDGVLLGRDSELVVEDVVPNALHVVPIDDHAALNGVREGESITPRGEGHLSDVLRATRGAGVGGITTHDRGEHGPRVVVSGKAGPAHARAGVDHKSLQVAHQLRVRVGRA
jgi:hypothetical protein